MSINAAARAARRLRLELGGAADEMERIASASNEVRARVSSGGSGEGGSGSRGPGGGSGGASGGSGSGSTGPLARTNDLLERIWRLQQAAAAAPSWDKASLGGVARRASR